MFGCEACLHWYHPKCVKVRASDAEKIDKFYCPDCQPCGGILQAQKANEHAAKQDHVTSGAGRGSIHMPEKHFPQKNNHAH